MGTLEFRALQRASRRRQARPERGPTGPGPLVGLPHVQAADQRLLYFGLFCMTIFGLFQTQIW